MRTHHRPFAPLTLMLMFGVATCGGGTTASSPTATTAPSGHCPASAGLPPNVSDHGTISASGSRLVIEANDFFFSATCVTGVAGGTATLIVHNAGQALHNVTIPALHVDMDVSAGQSITVQVNMGSTAVVFFCKYHKSVGMYGALLPSGTAHGCCCHGSVSGCTGAPAA